MESIKADLEKKYSSIQVQDLEARYLRTKKKEDFNVLYKTIMCKCDQDIPDGIKDDAEDGKDKMQVGNITLLDSHTNRSYHNALFPRKRRYIIVANGLTDINDTDEKKILLGSLISDCETKCLEVQHTMEAAQAAYDEGQAMLDALNAQYDDIISWADM